MKYVDVFRAKGGLGSEVCLEIIEKFFPDIIQALAKRGLRLNNAEVIGLAQNIIGLLVHAAIACCERRGRAPDKIRVILKISKDNKALIFFAPYSLDGKLEIPAKHCPMSIIGADPKDYEELKKKHPNVDVSHSNGRTIKNN